ncbi:hypothetical protein [Bacteroides congonensis]
MENILRNIVLGCLLSAGICLSSCGEEETYQVQKPTDAPETEVPGTNIPEDSRILTAEVDELFETAETSTRGIPEETQTIYQDLGNGLILEARAEKDGQMNTRTSTGSILSGARVLAIIYDTVQDTICKIDPTPTINGSSLTISFPTRLDNITTKIVFYSYNSSKMPSVGDLKIGDNIDNPLLASKIEDGRDVMWATTGDITGSTPSLGTIIFKHLFSQIRVEMTSKTGNITRFETRLHESCIKSISYVNIITGELSGGYMQVNNLEISASDPDSRGTVLLSDYINFISLEKKTTELTVGTVVLDKFPTVINKIVTFDNLQLKSGSRYTLKLAVKRWGIATGWTGDYYLWDAMDPFLGELNERTQPNSDIYARYSCRLCPRLYDAQHLLGQKVYYDSDGPKYRAYPTGTAVDQIKNKLVNKQIYRAGYWIAKESQWTNLTNTMRGVDPVTTEIRMGGNYVFVPAAGYLENGVVKGVGTSVRTWLSEMNVDHEVYCLYIDGTSSIPIGNALLSYSPRETGMYLFRADALLDVSSKEKQP